MVLFSLECGHRWPGPGPAKCQNHCTGRSACSSSPAGSASSCSGSPVTRHWAGRFCGFWAPWSGVEEWSMQSAGPPIFRGQVTLELTMQQLPSPNFLTIAFIIKRYQNLLTLGRSESSVFPDHSDWNWLQDLGSAPLFCYSSQEPCVWWSPWGSCR